MNKSQFNKLLTDIRFWIVFLFALRLVGITDAPLEVGHNWRQSLTNMIARNFFENGANILYPTIDMAGAKTGIIGSEFPFFNYLIYLSALVFDYSHWAGRLVNLVVSSIGLFYFYKLIKNISSRPIAFNSTIVLGVSIWFMFSRKIMPDTFSVSLVIIGLYYAFDYLKSGVKLSLVFFFTFSTLGILCKIPALSLFSVLGVLLISKEVRLQRKISLSITGSISFIIVCIWYFYWVPYLLETYQYQLYFPKGISEGIEEIIPLFHLLLEKFYFSALHSYLALACVVAGIALLIKENKQRLMIGIALITAVFIVFIIKTGSVFPLHNYYVIPYVPVMAFIAGYAIARLNLKYQYFLLALISIEAIANQQHDFRIEDKRLYKLELESIAEKVMTEEGLIIMNGGPSPQDMYFAHRKGWSLTNEVISRPMLLDSLRNSGAEYLILDKNQFDNKFPLEELVYEDHNYSIFKLQD